MTADEVPSALLALRRRVLRLTATTLAVGVVALAVVVPLSVPTSTWQDTVLLLSSAGVHAAAALTVGRRWEPGGVVCGAYLAVVVLLVALGIAISTGPESDAFWFLLIPLGLSALTMSARSHVAIVAAAIAAYAGASAIGPGLALEWVVHRAMAGVLFAAVLFGLARRLEQALVEVEAGHRELQAQVAELEVAHARLAELDLARDEFVSTVSHELRTPLTSVIGLSTTLDRHWGRLGDEERRRMIDLVSRNARAIEGIVASLLDLARIEQGGFQPARDPVDLSGLARDAVGRLEPVLAEHDVRLDLLHPATVSSDQQLLERVLDNLLANAARHTPAGTVVNVRTLPVADGIRFEVQDEGPGMTQDEVARLGERFYRAGADGERREGVGIGLALVGDVLTALGSELEVDSTPGEGSTFAFRLLR